MVTRDKIIGVLYFLVGAAAFAVLVRPDLRSPISDATLFTTCSVIFMITALYLLSTARRRAQVSAQEMQRASALRRLWLPPRFYSAAAGLWALRLAGAVLLVCAVQAAVVAFVAYR